MKNNKKVSLELCNQHLQSLFRAIEKGDLKSVYKLEHTLTRDEECVACSYALRAHGAVKEVLDTFLQEEGFVSVGSKKTLRGELTYAVVRLGMLVGLFLLFLNTGSYFKTAIVGARTVELGAFGLLGAFLLTVSAFVFVDEWVLE